MSRVNIEGNEMRNVVHGDGMKYGFSRMASIVTQTLQANSPPVYISDPGTTVGVKILLPPVADSKGLSFWIFNSAAVTGTLAVRDATDALAIVTIAAVKGAIVYCDGVVWRAINSA